MEDYQLLDFGLGRKLERFGPLVLDRLCPAADDTKPARSELWATADLRLDRKGEVLSRSDKASRLLRDDSAGWAVRLQQVVFGLRLTPFGHVGIFPEQASNWAWLDDLCRRQTESTATPAPLRCLNLFAYTGGTSLVLARAGCHVVHVDASQPAVAWARANAQASGLADATVRWIVEDARKFVAREIRRGNQYDLVVLDPPSFGHGPSGKRWDMEEHLPALLDGCVELLSENGAHLLLSAHSTQPSDRDVYDCLRNSLQRCGRVASASSGRGRLGLTDVAGRRLDAGFFLRMAVG